MLSCLHILQFVDMQPNLLDVFSSVEQLEIMLLYSFVLWIFFWHMLSFIWSIFILD